MRVLLFFVLSLLCTTFHSGFAQSVKPFKNGDRVVFLGNSITDGGHYHSYIWLYYMTRFPDMRISVMNAGIGGNTVVDLNKRLTGDVLSKKPSVLVVTFGMNDSGYNELNADNAAEAIQSLYKNCYENYGKLEQRLMGLKNTRIVLMGSSPYDQTAKLKSTLYKDKNKVIQRIVDFQRESAKRNHWEFTDLNEPMTEININGQRSDSSFTICGTDRFHPHTDGHMVMAYLFLKSQGMSGVKVAEVEIDATSCKTIVSDNCKVSKLRCTDSRISFDYLASSLPYPMDTTTNGTSDRCQAKAAKIVPFNDEMNREMVTIKGLQGDYALYIDGDSICKISGKNLSDGVNLALMTNTPQYRQALAVMHLNEYRWSIERNFRDYVWMQYYLYYPNDMELFVDDPQGIRMFNDLKGRDKWVAGQSDNYTKFLHKAVREAREQELRVIEDKIYKVNKPLVHRVEVRKL